MYTSKHFEYLNLISVLIGSKVKVMKEINIRYLIFYNIFGSIYKKILNLLIYIEEIFI